MVLDWRAPISSLLYFSSLGKTRYTAPAGEISVDLTLKRQFRLSDNKINTYIDTDTKIDDNILQVVLSQNVSSYMTNIVQTIQKEQNDIIRRSPQQTIIINGVAGSGKTSIAMHRIAYILYATKGKILSENILAISPNKLFDKYISDVLPELGEENVSCYTMMDTLHVANLTPKNYGKKIDMVKMQFEDDKRMAEMNIKYSLSFKKEVDKYLQDYDITPHILQLDTNFDKNQIVKTVSAISIHTKDIFNKIEAVIQKLLINNTQKISSQKLDNMIQNLVEQCKKTFSPIDMLKDIYQKYDLSYGDKDKLGYEDAPIYAYIKARINNVQKNYFIRHIFVDEMQDYDPFSLALLTMIYPDAVMTLAGDYNQNIISNQSNLDYLREAYPNIKVDHLSTSYRSTTEIIDFANNILDKESPQAPLIRHGETPSIHQHNSENELKNFVQDLCIKYPNDKIAIITTTEKEAIEISKIFIDFDLIINESDESVLTSKHIIITNYLSKGLEYDRVIVANVNAENYKTELDRKNLYVACTRALHALYITYQGTPSEFLPKN